MTPEELQRCLRAFTQRGRFRPFVVEFVSGDRITVTHPEAINTVGDLFVYRNPQGGFRVFVAASVCQAFDPLVT